MGHFMSDAVKFNPNNNRSLFVNTQKQGKVESANITQTPQQIALKNVNEFITQSAKSLSQFLTNFHAQQIQNAELSYVLKDLFNMQKDLDWLFASLTNNKLPSQMQKQDLAQLLLNSQLDLSKLKLFMHENGKDALSKLFNMAANYSQSGSGIKSSQMSEIIAILNACTPNADTSQIQVLKNLMLLYLPWLPLGEQNFTIQTGNGNNGSDEDKESQDTITVLISTVNFGNIQLLIFKSDNSVINFNIYASGDFPKDIVIKQITAEAKEYNVQTSMLFEKKEALSKQEKNENISTKVSVNTGKHVNPFLILMAQLAVTVIINLDKNISLLENRKEKL